MIKDKKKDPFHEEISRIVAEEFGQDWMDMENQIVEDAHKAELARKRPQAIKDIAWKSTSYKECLGAAMEFYGWQFDYQDLCYVRPSDGYRVSQFVLSEVINGPQDACGHERVFGKDVLEMAKQAWDCVSPDIKAIYEILDRGGR